MATAEDVMQWAYDLIVLDPYGNFTRKVSEALLDGILGKDALGDLIVNRAKALWTRPWRNFFQYCEIMVSNGSMNPETLFEHG